MILSSNRPIYKVSVVSLPCCHMFSLTTLYAKDLGQTLAKTPRYTPWSLSAVICGMDWSRTPALGRVHVSFRRRCIRQPRQREMNESESQTGASSSDMRHYRVSNWKGFGNIMPPTYFTYEKTGAQECKGICPRFICQWVRSFMSSTMMSWMLPTCQALFWVRGL